MAKFRDGSIDVLIATNVAARGLDIDGLAQVVNYDVPDSPDLFTHRTGRTGRMGGGGRSVTLVSGDDLDRLKAIERSLNRRLPRTYWDELQPAATNGSEPGANAEPLVATIGANGHRVLPGERLNGRPRRPEGVAAGGERRRNGRR
jgi:superfamily II DNA/RNA helicase